MKEIEFFGSDEIPLPLHQVRLVDFSASPYPDGRRVLCRIEFTPFQEKPSAEITIKDPAGRELTAIHIIQAFLPAEEITIHLPKRVPPGVYTASIKAYYLTETESLKAGENQFILNDQPFGKKDVQFSIP